MTKIIRCRDLDMDCNFEAKGETVVEVLKKVEEHNKKQHGSAKINLDHLKDWRLVIREV